MTEPPLDPTPEQGTAPSETVEVARTDEHEAAPEVDPSAGDAEPEDDSRLIKARTEAKTLRSRLREVEGERNTLRAEIARLHRNESARIAEDYLTDGEDLFRAGVELGDLRGENSDLDLEKVREAALRVANEHPNWTPNRGVPSLRPGDTALNGTSWQKVLKG